MNYRSLLAVGAVVLIVGAATTIDVPPVVWNPTWPVRLGMGGAGVLLSFGALLVGRRTATAVGDRRPDAAPETSWEPHSAP